MEWNSNKSKSSVHHNVFRGRVNRTAVRLNVSGHDVDVYGNLFLLETGGPRYPAIGSRGLRTAWNRIYHNIFVLFGEGPVLQSLGPIEINNNSYAVEGEALGRIENTDYGSLDEWRDALSDVARNEQADQGSVLAGRGFFDKHTRLLKVFHDFEAHEASVEVEGGAKEGGAPAKSAGEGQEQDVVAERVERRAHLDYLKGLLKDQDPVVVHLAIRALRKLGRAASPAVAGLGRLCNHSHAPIRAEAVTALGEIRIGAEIVIPELLVLLSDKDIHVVLPAIKTLQGFAHLARQAEADLRRLEKHSDERVREAAKAALVDILKQD